MNDKKEQDDMMTLIAPALADSALPAGMRQTVQERLMDRLGESIRRHAGLLTVRAKDGVWKKVKSGVRSKTLSEGPFGSSVLIELAPGAVLPVHRHRFLEEGIVLTGGMQMGDLDLGPGDYHVSPQGSRHDQISSRQGSLTYLRGTSIGDMAGVALELIGGLIPVQGGKAITVTTTTGQWLVVAEGVEEKPLWRDGQRESRFVRLAPGASLPAHHHEIDEECLVIEGDVFFGDILARSREFHLARAGSQHGEVLSDTGAVLFIHGGIRSH